MNDTKAYYTFLGILAAGLIIVHFLPTILPFMRDDEYFVDEYGSIHGDNCPYQDVPWFTTKHAKYDILIMENQEICRKCLSLEEDKLEMLHEINKDKMILRLIRSGATDEYIDDKMKRYR